MASCTPFRFQFLGWRTLDADVLIVGCFMGGSTARGCFLISLMMPVSPDCIALWISAFLSLFMSAMSIQPHSSACCLEQIYHFPVLVKLCPFERTPSL